jgi:hypothetical protein
MDAMPRWICAIAVLPLLLRPAGAAQLQPLAVRDGRVEAILRTEHADDQFLLILGSLRHGEGLTHVRLSTAATDDAELLPLQIAAPDPLWQRRVEQLAERQAQARQNQPAAMEFRAKDPRREKIFHLFVKDTGFNNPASYVAVSGVLAGVGKHCQVYVDKSHPDLAGLQPTIDDLIHTFDNDIQPRALGHVLDVDRDGRYTILMSGWLAKLQSGRVKLSGFVRGSDYYRDVAAPFGNRCDMMYLSTDLKPGPFLHTLVAHEYTHSVVFCEHLFCDYLPAGPRQDEESWLNEALSHLVEDGHGYSWTNLDYRISAYLSAPERYALVVPDYYGRNLWRDPGTRGCTYLFLRWCVDRFGPELLTRLVRSNLSGIDNLEAATQMRFEDLFRQWSTAMAVGGMGVKVEGVPPLQHIDLRGRLGSRLLCGQHFHSLALDGGDAEVTLAPTGVASVLLYSPAGPRSRLTVAAEATAEIQVSLIRLPRHLPRLGLACSQAADGDIRLSLTAQEAAVSVEEAAWERLIPGEEAHDDTSFRAVDAQCQSVRDWFGESRLQAGQTYRSVAIRLPPGTRPQDVVFKVLAVDDAGHRVSAWGLVEAATK